MTDEAKPAPEAPKPIEHKVTVGELVNDGGKPVYKGTRHENLPAIEKHAGSKSEALFDALRGNKEKHDAFVKDLDERAKGLKEGLDEKLRDAVSEHSMGQLTLEKIEARHPEVARHTNELISTHGGHFDKEFKTYETAYKELPAARHAIEHAEHEHMKALKPDEIKALGFEEAAFKDALKEKSKAVETAAAKTNISGGFFAGAKQRGYFTHIKENLFSFGKGNRMNSLIRLAGTGVGGYLVADGLLRSETVGEDGKPQARTGFERVTKVGVGALIAGIAMTTGRARSFGLSA